MRRLFVLRRFLTRLFADQPEQWILKGGTAIVLRLPNARPSKDLDLLRRGSATIDEALRDLRRAAERTDVDPFVFTIARIEERNDLAGLRLTIRCDLGPTQFDQFPIDMVIGKGGFVGPVEQYTTADRFAVPPEFALATDAAVYPVADQIADKLAAMYERHGDDLASTRYHDLADLILLADHFPIDHDLAVAAIDIQRSIRLALKLPGALTAPDPAWYTAWPTVASRTQVATSLRTLDAALAHVGPCYDVLLHADPTGAPRSLTWNPAHSTWI